MPYFPLSILDILCNPAVYPKYETLGTLKESCELKSNGDYDTVFINSASGRSVGIGNYSTSYQSISTSSSEYDISASTWEGGIAVEGKKGWAVYGASVSYTNEYTVTTGFTDTTTITGELPDVPGDSSVFKWGLLMYTDSIERSYPKSDDTTGTVKDSYNFVTYWTDAK